MDNTINYSIIIPHKNIPKLLDRCINSIPNRNDTEIIVVDDNSDDVSKLYELDSLKRSDIQLHLISKAESKGAGRARNLGLSVAKGKWCIFADADDFFITASLNQMMDTYINSSVDIVYFNIECLFADSLAPSSIADKVYKRYIEAEDAATICRYKLKVPWGKFIKRKLIVLNNIEFEETKVANDLIFSLKTGISACSTEANKAAIYTWLIREGSLSSIHSKDTSLLHFNSHVRYNNILKAESIDLYRKYRNNLFVSTPKLLRKSFSYITIFKMICNNTPKRYIIKDLFSAVMKGIHSLATNKSIL